MLRLKCRVGPAARGLGELCCQRSIRRDGCRRLSTTQAALSRRRASSRKKSSQAQPETDKGKGEAAKEGAPPEPMTAAEYERSLWEAQEGKTKTDDESDPQGVTELSDSRTSIDSALGKRTTPPKRAGHTATSSQAKSTRGVQQRSKGSARTDALWTSLQTKLREASAAQGVREDLADKGSDKDSGTSIPITGKPKAKGSAAGKTKKRMSVPLEVKTLNPYLIPFTPVEKEDLQVPTLSYNLDRVLFNPGVYQIQDARSQVFNFDPYLTTIMPVDEFDFDALKAYITSSRDTKLLQMSKKHGMKYCGSTSSMTSILSHFHYLLSAWRKPNLSSLSKSLSPDSENFTRLTRGPAAAYARLNDGVYAIDADKEHDRENILSSLGKSMEKLLTLPKEEFEKYRRHRSHLITEEERNADEAFHYTTLGDFLMRSQLDAHDPRLPGTGVFDLKTRAVVSIRMDVHGYQKGRGYEIRNRFGQWESFEREYYDLIRAAFLKYSLQVRMGRMDGIFLAYHNTQRIFGFQYVSLEEMDHAIHSTSDRRLGDQEFKASVALLNDLLDRAAKRFPGRSLRFHVETRPTKIPLTYFFVEPVTDEDMKQSQEAAKRSVERVQEDILSAQEREAESWPQEDGNAQESEQATENVDEKAERVSYESDQADDAWGEMMAKVEETIENESLGVKSVREAVHDALEQNNLLRDSTSEESEQYLDSLVEALTADSPGTREINEAWEREPGSSKSTEEATVDTQTGLAAESDELAEDKSRSTETGTSVEGEEKSTDAQLRALKDLIVRVTNGIADRRRELREFERVVAQLAARAKPTDSKPYKEQATTSEDASSSAPHKSPSNEAIVEDVAAEAAAESANSDGASASEAEQHAHAPSNKPREIMGMYVTIRNKVNGEFVDRPEDPQGHFSWNIEYTINEIPEEEARTIYPKMRKRRLQAMNLDMSDDSKQWMNAFRDQLVNISKQGERYREKVERRQHGKDVYVAWDNKPLPPEARKQGLTGSPTGGE